MAAKKKSKKKTQPAKSTRKKAAPAKKLAKRKPAPRKKLATTKKKKKTASKPASPKAAKTAAARKKPAARATRAGKAQTDNMVAFPAQGARARSGGQSGDLQGLSDIERSNSESVDELLEEGNTFEAEAVRGVEEAGNADEEEVHTHEVPEDDVPGEYLDND